MKEKKVAPTALYRGCKINMTTLGKCIVTIDGKTYPADDLQAAKDLIDAHWKTKGN